MSTLLVFAIFSTFSLIIIIGFSVYIIRLILGISTSQPGLSEDSSLFKSLQEVSPHELNDFMQTRNGDTRFSEPVTMEFNRLEEAEEAEREAMEIV